MYKIVQHITTQIGRFEIIRDRIEKDGEQYPYSYVKVKPGITVVPILNDEYVILLKEYRHAIGKWEYEFPSGFIEDDETPEQAVIRELKEETGLETEKVNCLGSYYPSFGSTDEMIHLFSCKICNNNVDLSEITKFTNKREPLEEISIEIMKIGELEKIMESGLFKQGSGIIAWYRLFNTCKRL